MQIILDREYWPTSTHGTLTINGKVICHTLEPPVIPGSPSESCLPEGSYLLVKEEQLPFLTLQKNDRGPFLAVICAQGKFRVDLPQTIMPVLSIQSEGQGTNPQKAFYRLTQALGKASRARENFRLEIRSCPDKALNLACCDTIAWMD